MSAFRQSVFASWRRASVQAIVLPLPRDWAGRQNQARPTNGIDGRKSGTFEGFNYSPANKSSGITWSEETFPKYIRAPMQEMPGTRMAFVGIKNDKDIADLSSNSLLMGRRNETRRAGKRGKSKRATRPGSPSGSSHVSVGLTGLLNPT